MSSSSRSSTCCSSSESTSAIVDATCCASTARHSSWRSAAALEATSRVVQVLDDTDQTFDGAEEIDWAAPRAPDSRSRATRARPLRGPRARRASGTGARAEGRAPTPSPGRRRAGTCRRTDATPWPRKHRGCARARAARTTSSRAARTTALLRTAASPAGLGAGSARERSCSHGCSPENNKAIVCCRIRGASRSLPVPARAPKAHCAPRPHRVGATKPHTVTGRHPTAPSSPSGARSARDTGCRAARATSR